MEKFKSLIKVANDLFLSETANVEIEEDDGDDEEEDSAVEVQFVDALVDNGIKDGASRTPNAPQVLAAEETEV
jgi:hypothetical protein